MIGALLVLAACATPGDTGRDLHPSHDASECGLHEDLPDGWNYREATGEGLDLIVVREYLMQGAGFTSIYALRGWALAWGQELTCLDDEAALAYVTGHHNWHDVATATLSDERQQLVVDYEHEGHGPRFGHSASRGPRPSFLGGGGMPSPAPLTLPLPRALLARRGAWSRPGKSPLVQGRFLGDWPNPGSWPARGS